MQLDDYVAQVQTQLSATAALGDEQTRAVAGTLATAAAPAVRLAIMAALAAAADEITAALLDSPGAPGIAIRLEGDDVRVEVTGRDLDPAPAAEDEGGRFSGEPTARISLRLSEALKSDVEAAAARAGVSVNTWLVRAAGAALGGPRPGPGWWAGPPGRRGGQHISGWING